MTVAPEVPEAVLAGIGLLLLSLLSAVAIVTLGRAVTAARRDRRLDAVRPAVRREITSRVDAVDPAWEAWVADASDPERTVAREVLWDLLQQVRGADRRSLQALGSALGLDERARRRLDSDDRFERLEALTWVGLLDVDVPAETIVRAGADHRDTREVAARLLYERRVPDATTEGTELLLADAAPLSVFGLDTLYHLHTPRADTLHRFAAARAAEWSDPLLIQVLQVVAEAGPARRETSLEWLVALLDHDSPTVRAAAAEALAPHGWDETVRAAVDVEALRTDPSPQVRRAVYRMLGAWTDRRSRAALLASLRSETDPWAATTLVRALGPDADTETEDVVRVAETDVGAEAEVDVGAETDADAGAETDADVRADTDADIGSATDADVAADVDGDTDTDTDTDTGPSPVVAAARRWVRATGTWSGGQSSG